MSKKGWLRTRLFFSICKILALVFKSYCAVFVHTTDFDEIPRLSYVYKHLCRVNTLMFQWRGWIWVKF